MQTGPRHLDSHSARAIRRPFHSGARERGPRLAALIRARSARADASAGSEDAICPLVDAAADAAARLGRCEVRGSGRRAAAVGGFRWPLRRLRLPPRWRPHSRGRRSRSQAIPVSRGRAIPVATVAPRTTRRLPSRLDTSFSNARVTTRRVGTALSQVSRTGRHGGGWYRRRQRNGSTTERHC
jgi:hypothetical protein